MHQTKDQLYEYVKDIYSLSDFERILNERYIEYGGLLDLDTLALLLVDEHGRNRQAITNIGDIKVNTECTVIGVISEVHQQRFYKRKNGCDGRILRVDITDDTGTCSLILWNDDIGRVNGLRRGVRVKVVNGYVKQGLTGRLEVHVGRWSLLEVLDDVADKSENNITKEERVVSSTINNGISGVITVKRPTHAYFMDNGEFGFVTSIIIKNGDDEVECKVWGEKVKELQSFSIGDRIRVINPSVRIHNNKCEYHINGGSIIERVQHPSCS